MQAPTSLSGSACAVFRACHPHDQTRADPRLTRDLLRGERLELDVLEPGDRGQAVPRFDAWKPSMSPTRRDGIPMSVKVLTASRKRFRSVRLPATDPWRWIRRPLK